MPMPHKLKLKKKKATLSTPRLQRKRASGQAFNKGGLRGILYSALFPKKLRGIINNFKYQILNFKSNLNNKFLKLKKKKTPFFVMLNLFQHLYKKATNCCKQILKRVQPACRTGRDDRYRWKSLLKIQSLSHSFKIKNFKPARQSLQLRLMAGGLKIKWLQNRFVRVKQPVHKLIAIILLLALITSIFLNPSSQNTTSAATYYFTQNSWAGGASTTALAIHPTNSTGWTKYQSASSSIIAGANSVTATTTSGTDTDTLTADFNGATSQTTVASDAVSLSTTSAAGTYTHTSDGDFSGGNFGSPVYTQVDTGQGRVKLTYTSGWFSGYTYRKQVTITGSSGAGTNYQVLLKVGETSGASGENFDLAGHAQTFPNDIRFTASDGTTALDYWVESTTGTTPNRLSQIWVEVSANLDTNQNIYVYYGKSGDTSADSGSNTFLTYDNFDTLSGWSGNTGSFVVSADRAYDGSNSLKKTAATDHANGYIYKALSEQSVEVSLWAWTSNNGDARGGPFLSLNTDYDNFLCSYDDPSGGNLRVSVTEFNNGAYVSYRASSAVYSTSPVQWVKLVLRKVGSVYTAYFYNTSGTLLGSTTGYTGFATTGYIGLHLYDSLAYADKFIARKYIATEPSYNTAGSETARPYYTPGTYTYYVDSAQATPTWSSFNFLKNASGGVTTLKVQVASKADTASAPSFPTGGACDSGDYTTNSTYTSADISASCAGNNRYLWYKVTFTASADTFNTPYLEQFQASTRVAYYSSGSYQSLITNTNQPNYSWGNLTWAKSGTGSIGMRVRTCNDSACAGETAIDSCTLFASSPANITSDTTCVHSGDQWIQYKAVYSGGDTVNPLSLDNVTANWNYYPTNQTLTSSPFDSSSSGNLIGGLLWVESATSTNATTTISIRTASTSALLTSSNWSDFTYSSSTCSRVGATTTCPTAAIPASMKDGVNDRWFQYKVTLTSNGASTTILSQVKVTYVVNAPPDIQTAASQGTDGLVTIGYRIRDTDTASGTTAGSVYVTLEYCSAASSTDCADTGTANWSTASAGAIVSGSLGTTSIPMDGSWQTSTSTVIWNPKVDYNAKYYNNTYKVRVKANDSEAANNLGYGVSNLFTLDTTNPVPAAVPIVVQATSSPARLNLNCVDSSTLYMRIGTTSALTGISYVAYAPTSTINIDSYNPATTTIYVQFKDQFNNTTTIQSAITPETPSAIMVQDTTNVLTNEFRLFLAWRVVALPTPGFGRYSLLKSASSTTGFTEISSTTDRNLNYFTDTAVNASTTYYYKLVTTDANNNASFYSATVNGLANGIQDAGEGGGGTDVTAPTLNSVSVSTTTTQSATIVWNTNEPSGSVVGYSTTSAAFTTETGVSSMRQDASILGQHSVTVTNLTPSTTYYFQAKSADPTGNTGTDNNSGPGYTFTTRPGPRITTGPTTTYINNNRATIVWATDLNSNSEVVYSTSSQMTNAITFQGLADNVTAHSVLVTGLTQNTWYYYYVKSMDGSSNTAIDDNAGTYYSFRTNNDITPPVLSNISTSTGRTSATITWNTDEDADSTVQYGTSTSYGLTSSNTATTTKIHALTLTNLLANTLYHFQVNSIDANTNSATSSDYTFTTDTLHLTNITASNVSTTTVNITWNTDEAAQSQVIYATSSNLTNSTTYPSSPTAASTTNSITLSGLSQATTYYYKASSTASGLNINSPIYQFTTGDQTAPTITNVSTSSLAVSTAVITWNTNEVANSRIIYGTATNTYTASTSDATLTTVHSLSLANLNATTTYYYRVISVDGNSNSATSSENSFKTASFQITNVIANNIATSTATINWSTDVLTSGQVLYSNDSSFTTPMIYPTLPAAAALSQSIQLFNLNQNTTYYYHASSTGFGLNLTSPLYQFLTGDTTAPNITNIASSTARTSASITWTTDEDANSQIDYGPTTGYGSQATSSALTKTHVLNLVNLSPVTLYHFLITSNDQNSNSATSSDYTFTTQAFSLTNVIASTTGITSMDINWSTNENANSQVEYATSSILTNSTLYPANPTNSTQTHSVSLAGLTQKTTYYYRASSTAGGDTKQSPIYYFTTGDSSAPTITNATSTLVTDTSAVITWTTDENADSILSYGTATGVYTASTSDATLTRNHSISLTSLTANTTYYYFLTSRDTNSNSTSTAEQTFATRETLYTQTEKEAAEATARTSSETSGGGLQIIDKTDRVGPVIKNVKVGNVKSTEATVEWETDESGTSIVNYQIQPPSPPLSGGSAGISPLDKGLPVQTGGKGDLMSVNNANDLKILTNSHKVSLRQLNPSSSYTFYVASADSSGNLSESAQAEFTTLSLSEEIAKNLETPTSDQIKPEEQKINNESFLDLVSKTIDILKSFASHVSINTLQTGLNNQYNSLEDLARLVPSPIMSGEPKVEVGATTASISWTTDKEANSLVAIASIDKYKVNDPEPYAQVVGLPSDNTTIHKVIIYDLKPDTLYHYQLRSKAPIGPLAKSGDFTFTTKKESLSIDSYNIANISSSKALFKWVTNSETDSNVKYIPYRGNTLAVTEAKSKYDKAVTTIHEITIDDLEAGIIYQIELSGKDAKNNSVQKVINPFSTEKDGYPPAINQVQTDMAISPGKDSRVQALISWVTDEPATSRVYYQKGFAEKEDISKMEKTQLDSSYTKKHIMVITKFESGSIYTFKVESTDSSGNTAISKTYTILAPKQTETIFEVILKNFESIFGWMKMM